MPNSAAADERLGDLIHFDRGLHAGVDVLLFEGVLQSQRVDDRGQHSHVVSGNAVHVLGLLGNPAEEVSAANYDRDLHAKGIDVGEFSGNLVNAGGVNTETLRSGQRLTGVQLAVGKTAQEREAQR